jgi:aspartate racemase
MMQERILGVLGGMGPLASAHFMTRLTQLTPAERDQDHIPAVLWSDPRVPDRTGHHQGQGPDPLPWLLRGVRGLRQAGCGAIAIPCNTAHAYYDAMAGEGVPILHIVEASIGPLRAIVGEGGPVGVVGTQATLAMRLYQERLEALGWDCLTPTPAEMERLVAPAIALVKANCVSAAYPPLTAVLAALAERGARAVILACTELPLAMRAGPAPASIPLIDTIDALALAAIRWAIGDGDRQGHSHPGVGPSASRTT